MSVLEFYSSFTLQELQNEQMELQQDHFELEQELRGDPRNQDLIVEMDELLFNIRLLDRLIDLRQAGAPPPPLDALGG